MRRARASPVRVKPRSGRFPTSERKPELSLGLLEPEDPLDLVPDGQQQEQGQPGEDGEGEEEAQPCVRLLALVTKTRVSASTVVAVGAVDRLGVDRRFFRWLHNASSSWLGHPGESIAALATGSRLGHTSAGAGWLAVPKNRGQGLPAAALMRSPTARLGRGPPR